METTRTTRTKLVTAALTVALAGCGLSYTGIQAHADEGAPEAQPVADAADQPEASAVVEPPAPTSNESAAAPASVNSSLLTVEQIAADPALAEQTASAECIGINFSANNDTASATALLNVVNANRPTPFGPDADLTSAAYQRAAESTLLDANIRPDGSLFTTIDTSETGRIQAEILISSNPNMVIESMESVYASLSEEQRALLLSDSFSSIGVGAVTDATGCTHWAILLATEGTGPSDATVNDGSCTYFSATPLANTHADTFGTDIAIEVGQSVSAPIPATVQGDIANGNAVSTFTVTKVNINSNAGTWNSSNTGEVGQSVSAPIPATVQGDIANGNAVSTFTVTKVNINSNAGTWNSSNTGVASAVDGTITGISSGSCEVSMTNALSTQEGMQYLYRVTVSGGEEANAIDLADCTIAGISVPYPFSGAPVEPPFTVIDANNQIVDPSLYTVTYQNNDAPGEATLTITANPDTPSVVGEKTCSFTIEAPVSNPEPPADTEEGGDDSTPNSPADTSGVIDETPGGSDGTEPSEPSEPTDTETPSDGMTDGTPDTPTEETPDNPSDPSGDEGASSNPSEGEGEGEGESQIPNEEQPSQVQPVDLASEQVTVSLSDPNARFVYNGQEFKPAIVVKDGDRVLEINTDYTISYENNVNAGTAQAVINGASSLVTGSRNLSFTIEPQSIASYDAGPVVSATYNGNAIVQEKLEVKNGTSVLRNGIDYTVAYENNVNAGTATLRITGINNFAGEKELKFTITPASMAKTTVVMPNEAHTGQALTPTPVSVMFGDIPLTLGVDYDVVAYGNNINVGNATATLQGKGNYEGTVVANWKIVQQGTADNGTTQTLPKTGDATNIVPIIVGAVAGVVLVGAAVALLVACGRSRKNK